MRATLRLDWVCPYCGGALHNERSWDVDETGDSRRLVGDLMQELIFRSRHDCRKRTRPDDPPPAIC